MKIINEFTYHQRIIYIPDGHISDIKEFQRKCSDWIYSLPECWIEIRNLPVCSFGENEILRYVNEVLLAACKEKAYFMEESCENREGAELLYW